MSIDNAIQDIIHAKNNLSRVTINHNIDTSRLVPDDQDKVELLMREGQTHKRDATSRLISAGISLDDLNAVKEELEKDYSPNYIEAPHDDYPYHEDRCMVCDTDGDALGLCPSHQADEAESIGDCR